MRTESASKINHFYTTRPPGGLFAEEIAIARSKSDEFQSLPAAVRAFFYAQQVLKRDSLFCKYESVMKQSEESGEFLFSLLRWCLAKMPEAGRKKFWEMFRCPDGDFHQELFMMMGINYQEWMQIPTEHKQRAKQEFRKEKQPGREPDWQYIQTVIECYIEGKTDAEVAVENFACPIGDPNHIKTKDSIRQAFNRHASEDQKQLRQANVQARGAEKRLARAAKSKSKKPPLAA